MTWVTGSATGYQDLLDQLVEIATSEHLSAAVTNAAGTGYVAGEVVTLSGGTFTHAAKIEILTVGGSGEVATFRISEGGAYTVTPTDPISTTGGSGSGFTVDGTFDGLWWTLERDESPGGERQVILQGEGTGGTDEILVGIKSYSSGLARNWWVGAFSALNAGLAFYEQPGISPGLNGTTGVPVATGGAFVPLHDNASFPMNFWISVSQNRICGAVQVENATVTRYSTFYLGFLNRYGTSSEFPYPIYVGSSSAREDTLFTDTQMRYTGLTEAVGINGRVGPGFYRRADSVWQSVQNSSLLDTGSPSRIQTFEATIYPCGETDSTVAPASDQNIVVDGTSALNWQDIIPPTGVPGAATKTLEPSPDSGDDLFALIPATLVLSVSTFLESVGELDGVYWFHTGTVGSVPSPKDTFRIDGEVYRVIPCGNRTEDWSFMAIREA